MATQDEALAALFDGVVHVAGAAKQYGGTTGSKMIRDAGIAYRAAVGGDQPEIVDVDVKA